MKALIFGISGQDGVYLSQFLLNKGYKVFGTSRDTKANNLNNLKKINKKNQIEITSLNLKDFQSVLKHIDILRPDEIYNLSGLTSVSLSFEKPVEALESIANVTLNILEAILFIDPTIKYFLLSLLTARAASMAAVTTPKADLRYVSLAASDAANQVANPVAYPRDLYPEIEPFETGYLDVGNHKLYYDLSGNPNGVPCIFLHGGPGAGCSPRSRRFFDPAYYKIVILDQRGSGKSIPNAADDLDGSLVENTTPALVHDIDLLRAKLGIERWGVVLGGSWGSTLALAYAQAHPDRCSNLLLRGVFLFGPDEVEYLFCNGGTFGQNPGAWSKYVQYLEDTSSNWAVEKTNLLGAYWTRLTSSDAAVRSAAAAAFVGYELSISKTYTDPAVLEVR